MLVPIAARAECGDIAVERIREKTPDTHRKDTLWGGIPAVEPGRSARRDSNARNIGRNSDASRTNGRPSRMETTPALENRPMGPRARTRSSRLLLDRGYDPPPSRPLFLPRLTDDRIVSLAVPFRGVRETLNPRMPAPSALPKGGIGAN